MYSNRDLGKNRTVFYQPDTCIWRKIRVTVSPQPFGPDRSRVLPTQPPGPDFRRVGKDPPEKSGCYCQMGPQILASEKQQMP